MRGLLLPLLIVVLLGACSKPEDCAQLVADHDQRLQQKDEVIAELQAKIAELRETLSLKHQEVTLHRRTPEVAQQLNVGLTERLEAREAELAELRVVHDRLQRRFAALEQELERCRQERGTP